MKQRKIIFTLFTVLSIIGYGTFVFAVTPVPGETIPFVPGETLDPTNCEPGDTYCKVQMAIDIGSSVVGGTPNQILYTDASGNVAGDANFIWDATNSNFAVGAPFLGSTGVSMILNSQASLAGILTDGSFKVADRDINNVFDLNVVTNKYKIGDLSNANNSTVFTVDDDTRTISANVLDVGANILSTSIISATGNMVTWDADTADDIQDGFIQGDNLNGVNIKGSALAHSNTSTFESASFFAGDSTAVGGNPYEASMAYVLPGGINGAFAYTVNDDGLKAEYYDIVGNIKSQILQEAAGNTILWDVDTTDALTDSFEQGQDLFGIGLKGNGVFHRSTTGDSTGLFAGDATSIGLGPFTTYMGSATTGALTMVAAVQQSAFGAGDLGQNGNGTVFALNDATQTIAFNYDGDYYKFPIGDGDPGQVMQTDGNNQLSWATPGGADNCGSKFCFTIDGNNNMFAGTNTGSFLSSGANNFFAGIQAGEFDTTGGFNTFTGYLAGWSNTTGNGNSFFGSYAGYNQYAEHFQTAIGYEALKGGTPASGNIGGANVALGYRAGYTNTTGQANAFLGYSAGYSNTEGYNNTFSGFNAGWSNTAGSYNVFNGYGAGDTNIDGINNVVIGGLADVATSSTSNAIAIGYGASAAANQFALPDSVVYTKWRGIGYEFPSAQAGGVDYVLANDGAGTLSWLDSATIVSDSRLKSNVVDLGQDILSKLGNVRTVTYTLNSDESQKVRIGFVAQDLEQTFPELVTTRDDGYKAVYYAQMTPVLVEAARELNLKITDIENFASAENKTFLNNLIAWLGDVGNGIGNFFATSIHSRETITELLCVGTEDNKTCLNKDQIDQVLQNGTSSGFGYGYGGN